MEVARKLKDWPKLKEVTEKLVEYIAEVVEWWDSRYSSADQGISTKEGENIIGYSNQKISRWRKRLENPEQFLAEIRGAEYAEAVKTTDNAKSEFTGENERGPGGSEAQAIASDPGQLVRERCSELVQLALDATKQVRRRVLKVDGQK